MFSLNRCFTIWPPRQTLLRQSSFQLIPYYSENIFFIASNTGFTPVGVRDALG
jgi:hypothetical protein